MKPLRSTALTLLFLAMGCADENGTNPGPDGGTDASVDAPDTGMPACELPAPVDPVRFDALAELPRFVVTGTDFSSSYVGFLNADGFAVDGNWVNSGTKPPGLTNTFSGDISTPTRLPGDGSFYIIDRYGTNAITRVTLPQGVGFVVSTPDGASAIRMRSMRSKASVSVA